MTFGSRIGGFFRAAAQRIGQMSVAGVLTRVGAIASAGHKVASLANAVTGGGLTHVANSVIGSRATSAIGAAGSYLAKAYDASLLTKAQMSGNTGAAPGARASGMTLWSGGGTVPKQV